MAIDTAAKRFSAIHHGSPWRGIAVLPTGTIGQASRQAALRMYSGILFGGGGATGPGRLDFTLPPSRGEFTTRRNVSGFTLPRNLAEFTMEKP